MIRFSSHEQCNILESAIRKHRDQRGDDRCWLDDEELYKTLTLRLMNFQIIKNTYKIYTQITRCKTMLQFHLGDKVQFMGSHPCYDWGLNEF